MRRFFVASFLALITILKTRRVVGQHNKSLLRDGLMSNSNSGSGSSNTTIVSLPLIPHSERFPNATVSDDVSHRKRRRHLSSSSSSFTQVNPLYQGYGTHYVDLWVGTPIPQRQTLIVDTGSAITAFPCEQCSHSCGKGHHVDSYYRESSSRTFEVMECHECKIGSCSRRHDEACMIHANYQEGSSWHAFEASDVVYSGGPHDHYLQEEENKNSFRLRFGCQTRLEGFFKTQLADGIMGMEMSSSSIWKQMYKHGVLQEKSFALCLSQQSSVSRKGTSAGTMTLGGVDTRLHANKMVYANQLNNKGWFVVRLKRLFLRAHGGVYVQVPKEDEPHVHYLEVNVSERDLNNGNIVLDSGTTDTYLSSHLYHDFDKAWKSLMGGRSYNNGSHRYTDQQLLALPTVLFQLEAYDKDDGDLDTPGLVGHLDERRPTDVLVAMPPTHYMEYNPTTQRYSSRLYFNEKRGGVLGANFMMGHDVLFDAHHGRIGFAESTCDYEKAV